MILQAGFEIRVWARRPEVGARFAGLGARAAQGPADLAAQCDLLCLCVTDEAALREVLLARDALVATPAGSTIAIHATVAPALIRELASRATARSVALIDAPVSGSGHAARARSLLLMAGGDAEALAWARPVFESFAGTILHMGPAGTAMAAKLINNLLAAVQIGHAAAALRLGQGLGIDPDLLRTAVLAGTGRSFAMDAIERFRDPPRAVHVRRILEKDVALALAELTPEQAGAWGPLAQGGLEALRALAEPDSKGSSR
jgi:3-hydroxyisobutyrate dehydrogenase